MQVLVYADIMMQLKLVPKCAWQDSAARSSSWSKPKQQIITATESKFFSVIQWGIQVCLNLSVSRFDSFVCSVQTLTHLITQVFSLCTRDDISRPSTETLCHQESLLPQPLGIVKSWRHLRKAPPMCRKRGKKKRGKANSVASAQTPQSLPGFLAAVPLTYCGNWREVSWLRQRI